MTYILVKTVQRNPLISLPNSIFATNTDSHKKTK